MKKYLVLFSTAVFLAGMSGCGDNKTKQKLVGTDVVSSTSMGGALPATQNPTASSVSTLYKVAYFGTGVGSVSAAPRHQAPGISRVSAGTGGLPTPNADGTYSITDPSGMTVTLAFKYSGDTVYLKLDNVLTAANALRTYEAASLTSTEIAIGQNDQTAITNLALFFQTHLGASRYIPALWCKAGNAPIDWFPFNGTSFASDPTSAITTMTSQLTTFLTTKFPTTMVNTVRGAIPGATVSLDLTSAMPSQFPTNANPATLTGSGTITLTTGEVLTVTANLSIGASGPIGGTQTFTSSTGETGTLTFAADGSMTGTIYNGSTLVATVSISSSGTGTFTDVSTGQTYSIADAKPAL